MTRTRFTKRRMALLALPVTGAVLLGGAGWAAAAGHGTGHGEGANSGDHPAYHSSVTTTAKEGSGSEAAGELALTKLAKIDLARAAQAGTHAVPGGRATGVSLEEEGGNVVYTVDVVTAKAETEVVVDAGNARVLAKTTGQEDEAADHDKADNADRAEQQAPSGSQPSGSTGGSGASNGTGQ